MKIFEFLSQNIGTIAVLLVLVAIVGVIVFFNLRSRKQGKSSCGNGCSGCPYAGKCHSAGNTDGNAACNTDCKTSDNTAGNTADNKDGAPKA